MFTSVFRRLGEVYLPAFSGLRIMMMPIVLGDAESLPAIMDDWRLPVQRLFECDEDQFGLLQHCGKVGYLTIDEKTVYPSQAHRRVGLHVDGIYHGGAGKWGGGGPWASKSTGAITVSSHVGCRAWAQDFDGWPGPEGECGHLESQCLEPTYFEPNVAYWFSGMCVHESIAQTEVVKRQFVRLSLPSDAPWFDGYTVNPLGIMPTGEILPRREFMEA